MTEHNFQNITKYRNFIEPRSQHQSRNQGGQIKCGISKERIIQSDSANQRKLGRSLCFIVFLLKIAITENCLGKSQRYIYLRKFM